MNFKDTLVKSVVYKNHTIDVSSMTDKGKLIGYEAHIANKNYQQVGWEMWFNTVDEAVKWAKGKIDGIKDSACSYIDSVVGNIARKIEDEFNESDHPRDKGGKFTSKGGEGKGGKKEELSPDLQKKYDRSLTELVARAMKKRVEDPRRQEPGFYGGEKVKQEDPKKGDALNEHAVKLEKAGADPKEIHRLNREGDLEGMKKLLEETETEKAAREELGEKEGSTDYLKYEGDTPEGKETDRIYEEFKSSGIDMYAALSDLGLDVFNTPESYLEDAFKEALFNSPKFRQKAQEYIRQYRGADSEEEEPEEEDAAIAVERALVGKGRGHWTTHPEDLVENAKDAGYEAELESEEYMRVSKDGKEFRVNIGRAGSDEHPTYYINRIEEL